MSAASLHEELMQLRAAVQRNPSDFIAWVMLADVEIESGDARTGMSAAQYALTLHPEHPEALARLGRSLWAMGKHAEATIPLRAASNMVPQHPGMALWLGHALEDAGEAEAAAQAYEQAYRLMPGEPIFAAHLLNWRRKLCDWRDLATLSDQIKQAVNARTAVIEPFAFLSEDASAEEQLACARLRATQVAGQVRPLPATTIADGKVLRLGFLSNGFGAHPTGLLTANFFESLSGIDNFETHLFATRADDGSLIRKRLAHSATQLHEVAGERHDAIAARIRAAGIDILYDLRGWGGGGLPEVLAQRPAPLQVNWLAYPGTSGAPWIDYVLADRFVLPADMAPAFSECVARLPRCFQPSDTRRDIPQALPRASHGLPAAGVVFACFNNSYKLNPASFERMLAILAGVPGSVLWLLSGPGLCDQRLQTAARANGVDPARLVFLPKQPHAAYMACYHHVDLFLDTNPYNAHTTASDALWAGCPVLTRPGHTFAARVAGSLNHHLGLHEMNVETDVAFIAKAVALGRNLQAMQTVRDALQQARKTSGLFDMAGFARDFAAVAWTMAMRSRQGLSPASFG